MTESECVTCEYFFVLRFPCRDGANDGQTSELPGDFGMPKLLVVYGTPNATKIQNVVIECRFF